MIHGNFEVLQLGLQDYQDTFEAMQRFTQNRNASTKDQLWVVEHPAVFTLGLAGDPKHLLQETTIPLIQTDRGGQITYHGPGQVIVYVLLDLKRLGFYVKELVRRIEQSVIATLAELGVQAERHPGSPGIYLTKEYAQFAGAKIAALGLKIKNHYSYHGLALNVKMDLSPFQAINPCGYPGLQTIDLATLGVTQRDSEVANVLIQQLLGQLSITEE